ncbi:MAG: hypothetical protein Q8O56_05605 [Solirubrobacteraceae bacterium]|nr:hypothetical protein [Solirubrobacteraceae bacterium]
MTFKRIALSSAAAAIALAIPAAAGSVASAQNPTPTPRLLADALNLGSGPTVIFREESSQSDRPTPRVKQMDIGRPARMSVRAPPSGRSLGTLSYEIGPRTQPAREIQREVTLRRRVALGNGRYSLANSRGARVVISTRSQSTFVQINLPTQARSVTLRLRGDGARLLTLRGGCTGQRFTARFVTPDNEVHRSSSTVSTRRTPVYC